MEGVGGAGHGHGLIRSEVAQFGHAQPCPAGGRPDRPDVAGSGQQVRRCQFFFFLKKIIDLCRPCKTAQINMWRKETTLPLAQSRESHIYI